MNYKKQDIISIHAPPRGATVSASRSSLWHHEFQFTPLREGRRQRPPRPALAIPFQFTPLREGRRPRLTATREDENFNSRPSARGDKNGCNFPPRSCISIHAPPRGATGVGSGALGSAGVFQFTPLREGRPPHKPWHGRRPYFNSRPSARGDDEQRRTRAATTTISIHAPPRGATATGRVCLGTSGISIHAPPRGATRRVCAAAHPCRFQFTPLREGRRQRPPRPALAIPFQFTPLREGRHAFQLGEESRKDISIHAPPRGATIPARSSPPAR